MIPMTPEAALENAVKALYEARHETDPGRAATLVQAADVWTRLHVALVNAPKETEPVPLPGDEDVYEALRRDAAKMGAKLAATVKANRERDDDESYHRKRALDLWRRLEDAGEKARQALGIDGTMGDAQDVPHPYNDDEGAVPYCIVCGLAGSARAHKRLPEEGQG